MTGWLVAVKEIIDVAGVETTANTRVRLPDALRWPEHDAPVIARLREGGAVIGPKTTTHEFAWGITTAQPDREQAVNPRAHERVTGGSSGGAAAMVARGEARLGLGTDTGGSIRIPSAWCGLVGWKPTQGLIPTAGVLALAPSLDHVGFMAADVESLVEAARLFGVRMPEAAAVRVAQGVGDAPMDRTSAAAVEQAGSVLGAAGEARLPATELLWTTYRVIQMREALGVHRHVFGTWPSQQDRYAADVAPRMEMAERVTDAEEVRARIDREQIRTTMLDLFADADVIVTPTTGCAPPLVSRPDVVDVDGTELAIRDVVMAHTVVANLCGLPVVCLPVGEGTPADALRSVQLIGPPGTDGLLLCVAARLFEALSAP